MQFNSPNKTSIVWDVGLETKIFTSKSWSGWRSAPDGESVLTERSSVFRLGYLYTTIVEDYIGMLHAALLPCPPALVWISSLFTFVNIWNAQKSLRWVIYGRINVSSPTRLLSFHTKFSRSKLSILFFSFLLIILFLFHFLMIKGQQPQKVKGPNLIPVWQPEMTRVETRFKAEHTLL